ncbi:MAG: hypothetical protein ACI85U_000943 [Candidatus Promineifilaceae bacterium]|jgi:hypothetical protein
MEENTTNINSGGGTVITGRVQAGEDVVLGDKIITINQILADEALTNEATVLAYLENAAYKNPPPEGSAPEIERLWNAPFFAHQAGESSINLIPIWKLVRDQFQFAQDNQLPHSLLLLANAGLGKTGALSVLMDARATLSVINYKSDQAKSNKSGGSFQANRTFIIPIFLDLEQLLGSDMSLNDLVSDSFNSGIPADLKDDAERDLVTKEESEAFLAQYTCLFLIDNLDLLITKSAHDTVKAVRQFIKVNHRHQFVIACRPTHYRGQLGQHKRIFLNELTNNQVEKILAGPLASRLRGPMRDLSRNRAHLKMIIEIPRGRRSQGFPPLSKGHLVQHAERKRLEEAFPTDQEQKRAIDVEVAEEVLERLAFEVSGSLQGTCSDLQAQRLVNEFLEEWDEPYNWRVVMHELRHAGLLQRVGRRGWGFVRRKTESYFAAASLVENLNKVDGNLNQLSMPRGNETLEILIGLIPNPEHLIDKLLAGGHVFTAAHVGQFPSRTLEAPTLDKLFDALMEQMKGEHASQRAEIALQLGESGHEAAIKALVFLLVNERSSLVVKSIAMAIWVGINQIDPKRFDKILYDAISSLKDSKHVSNLNMPDENRLFAVLHVFERSGSHRENAAEQHKQLVEMVVSPEEHRLIRGLAGFGLGFMADGLLQRSESSTADGLVPLSKGEIQELNRSARERLLQFLEFRYSPPDHDIYAEEKTVLYPNMGDDLFVSWCCADALTQLDDNSVLVTAMRLCNSCVGDSADETEIRAQAVYIMGALGRRTAHKHDLVSQTLLNLLREETHTHNVRAHGYAAQAVSRLWISDQNQEAIASDVAVIPVSAIEDDSTTEEQGLEVGSKLSDSALRERASQNLVKCRDQLEVMMAESHDSWLRRKISEALGQIGSGKALELLNQQMRLEKSRTRSLRHSIQLLNERLDEQSNR